MYCSKCGNQLNETQNFCNKCGHPVNKSTLSQNPAHPSSGPTTTSEPQSIDTLTARFMKLMSEGGSEEEIAQLERDMQKNIEGNVQKINQRETGSANPELILVNPKVSEYEKPISDALHKHTETFFQQEFGNTGPLMISPLGFPSLGNIPIMGSFDPGTIFLLNTWIGRHIEDVRNNHPNNVINALTEANEQLKNPVNLGSEDLSGFALGFAHCFAIPDLKREEYRVTLEGCITLLSIEQISQNAYMFLVLAEALSHRITPSNWNRYLDFCELLLRRGPNLIAQPQFLTSITRGLIFYLLSLNIDSSEINQRIQDIKSKYFK